MYRLNHSDRDCLIDILERCEKIQDYILGYNFKSFQESDLNCDAVERNIEVIGEIVKSISQPCKDLHHHIPWKIIAGTRDILIHKHKFVDVEIVWDIAKNKIPDLAETIRIILNENSTS